MTKERIGFQFIFKPIATSHPFNILGKNMFLDLELHVRD